MMMMISYAHCYYLHVTDTFYIRKQVIDTVAAAITDGVPEEASDRLITRCLQKSASEGGLTLQQLKTIPPGK
jgi:hypothetical protein